MLFETCFDELRSRINERLTGRSSPPQKGCATVHYARIVVVYDVIVDYTYCAIHTKKESLFKL